MSSSTSSPKRGGKGFFEFRPLSAFDIFYQLTYMSAMASAGITRSKTFELAALSGSPAADYFVVVNTLVDEIRLDYPDACRTVGEKAKSDSMKSFLLRFSDALRSGEPLADFLAREAEVQGVNYQNEYERDIESLKQWTDAFSSIVVSVSLIVIVQVVSSMIYSMDTKVMVGLVTTGLLMSFFGAWIISRSAPREVMTVKASQGSEEQRRAYNIATISLPILLVVMLLLVLLKVNLGIVMIVGAALLLPVGIVSLLSDKKTVKKNEEFSTFLRSVGGMASSSGTTLKDSLTKIDLSSFPTMQQDIARLSTRLNALVDPTVCWHKFGQESGSRLIAEATSIFYSAITMGGDPERVGYLCSLFTSTTAQLRAKRRLVASTFSGLTLVMQAVVAGLMIFVLEVVNNFIDLMNQVMMPDQATEATAQSSVDMSLAFVIFTPEQLRFLTIMTVVMVVLLAIVSAVAIIFADGGYKLKTAFFLSLAWIISGLCFLVVPPMVAGILSG
jgi:flagellar protein FlaJ